jgi:hypothetical protein
VTPGNLKVTLSRLILSSRDSFEHNFLDISAGSLPGPPVVHIGALVALP